MGDFGAFLGRRGAVGFNGCCSGRAVVTAVSRWPVSAVAVVTAISVGDCELTGSGTAVPKLMMAAVVHAVRS